MRNGLLIGLTLGAITTAVCLKTPIVKKIAKSMQNRN